MRRKGKLFRSHKELSEWITSYVVVLVIPILICSVFFIYNFIMTWEETRNLNASALRLVSEELDEVFEKSIDLEFSIQKDKAILNVRHLDKNMSVADNYKLYVAKNAMQQYSLWDDSINNCSIFFPKLEVMVSDGYRNISNKYSEYAKIYGMTEELFREMLFSRHTERLFFKNVNTGDFGYIYSYPTVGNHFDMNLIVEIKADYIQEVLSALDNMSDSGIMILDYDGNVLAERNVGNISVSSVDVPKDEVKEYHVANIDGKNMLVSSLESEVVALTYVSVIPYTVFWHRAIESIVVFVLALLTCTILGLSAAWFFAKIKQNTYGRLNDLIKERLKNQTNQDMGLKQKEIAFAIQNLVEEYESMQKQLDSADEKKRELILSSIIAGRIRNDETERVLRVNEVVAEFGNFALLILRSNQYGDLFDRAEEQRSSTEMEKMAEAVAWVVKEIEKYGAVCEILRVAGNIVCICDFGSKAENDCDEELLSMTANLKEEIEKIEGHITISISAVHNQVLSLNSAYTEATRVMEYQLTDRKLENAVMNYAEMIKANQMCYLFTVEDEVEIMGLMKSGKGEEAVSKVNALCEKNVLLFNGNHELANCLVMNLVSCVLQVENGMKNREKLSDPIIWMKQVTKNVSVYDRVKLINQRIQQICSLIADTRANKDIDLVKQIQAYIMNNYQMEGLGNSEIADYFGISSGYLSTFFKENTGVKLTDYIHQLRVEKAKELLVLSNLNVEQISSAVGCNSLTLRRLFKKYVGISPIQYREDNSKKEV